MQRAKLALTARKVKQLLSSNKLTQCNLLHDLLSYGRRHLRRLLLIETTDLIFGRARRWAATRICGSQDLLDSMEIIEIATALDESFSHQLK